MKRLLSSLKKKPKGPRIHFKCRNTQYLDGPERCPVPDDQVKWSTEYPEYSPVPFVAKPVKAQPVWADNPADVAMYDWNGQDAEYMRKSHDGPYLVDPVSNLPLNPVGRTGIVERGLLGRFGPNFAADPVVTRWKRDESGAKIKDPAGTPVLEVVLIKRKDTGEWAIPGGMVEWGDSVSLTLKKEFGEEALNSMDATPAEAQALAEKLDKLFDNGHPIYTGYVDDPRNTDNAWMETTVVNFHDEDGTCFQQFALHAGDDAGQVAWVDISRDLKLYASHYDFIDKTYRIHVGKPL
eukprot:m.61248 g.61248  ORF g.61248 m.61248 type:complete len:294 (-) comp11853_c0_seq2:2532-3413(-)